MSQLSTFTAYAEITSRNDISANEKILLCLVRSFSGNGTLFIGNEKIGKLLGLSAGTVSNLLVSLEGKNLIRFDNRQSRWRKIILPLSNGSTLPSSSGSKSELLPSSDEHTSTEQWNITKRIKETEGRSHAPPTPEQIAEKNFNKIKAGSSLPGDFLTWFDREILGRFNKYAVSAVVLGDWYALYDEFGGDDMTAAVRIHRSESERWEPCLSAVKKAAEMIRAGRKKQQREDEKRQADQKQNVSADPPGTPTRWWDGAAETVALRYQTTTNQLEKKLIQRNRPDAMKIIQSVAAG